MAEGKNKQLKESVNSIDGWHCPYPFVVHSVFQKFGIKNANGRVYPEHILKREVEKYQQLIKEKRALGECYTPDVLVLTENGWKTLNDVKENENVLTLNTKTNEIEIKPVLRKIEYDYNDNMIHIKGNNINDIVTPNHGYPIYNRRNKFKGFYTAENILNKEIKNQRQTYIPKQGKWVENGEDYFILKGYNTSLEKYKYAIEDKKIPMSTMMKFLGIYLANGEYDSNDNIVIIRQKKGDICDEVLEMLTELELYYTVSKSKDKIQSRIFKIIDPRLFQFVLQIGDNNTKHIPTCFKQQSKENLTIFYNWFIKCSFTGNNNIKIKHNDNENIFSSSKQLILDLNEIQLKIGYSGNFNYDEDKKMYYSLMSLNKGIYLDDRFITVEKETYNGKVMCLEVENHTFYVMSNGKCHWSKNCNHPAESTIDLGRISHNITELHWEGRTLVGELELNLSKGFVEQGICSTLGDTCANLLLNGYKIGVSSRGVGSVEQKLGVYTVGDDFELICFDIVSTPSTPNAFIGANREELQPYIENTENKKTVVNEKIDKIKTILNS